jgi:anaerobic nitric oxide reductase transcription regulator
MRADQPETFQGVAELMGASPPAETLRAYVARASDTHEAVLIAAEHGLNALAVCKAIHEGSELTAYPFVPIEAAQQTAASFERDIAALSPRRTIALMNLDELASPLQHRLFQQLPHPGNSAGASDVRLLAVVSGTVEDAVGAGKLSRDLAARFPLQLEVPPVRRRGDDFAILIGCVAAEAAAGLRVGVPQFSRDALALLAALPWRRNFDELREVLDVLVLVAEGGTIQLDAVLAHVPIQRSSTRPAGASSLREARNHFEREYITSVLNRHRGRMDEAARALGVQRTNLYRKVRQLGIGRARSR